MFWSVLLYLATDSKVNVPVHNEYIQQLRLFGTVCDKNLTAEVNGKGCKRKVTPLMLCCLETMADDELEGPRVIDVKILFGIDEDGQT